MIKLKPCPFCGGNAYQYGGGLSQEGEIVECETCRATVFGNHENWNKRIWIEVHEHYIVSDEMKEIRALLLEADDKIASLTRRNKYFKNNLAPETKTCENCIHSVWANLKEYQLLCSEGERPFEVDRDQSCDKFERSDYSEAAGALE